MEKHRIKKKTTKRWTGEREKDVEGEERRTLANPKNLMMRTASAADLQIVECFCAGTASQDSARIEVTESRLLLR